MVNVRQALGILKENSFKEIMVMTTRVMEIRKPRFTLGEQKNLIDGKAIELFGVKIEHRAGKWFRLDAPDVQSLEHILAILTGGYAGE